MAIPRNLANIAPHVNASSTELVVNDGGADLNFRVEGDSDANLLFVDASTDRVGIGTNTPDALLNVDGIASFGAGAAATPSIAAAGDLNTGIFFPAADTIAASTAGLERMRIDSSGHVGINQSTTDRRLSLSHTGTAAVQFNQLDATSIGLVVTCNSSDTTGVYFRGYSESANAIRIDIFSNGNVVNTNNSYGAISDVKLKQDIVNAASQWDDIKGLRVRKFRYKSDPDGFMQMGLVAQEAELVSPGLIDEHPDYEEVEVPVFDDEGNQVLNEDGTPQVTRERNALGTTTKSVKYSVLYMKAVKALQEAMERIETLEAKVAALEAQ